MKMAKSRRFCDICFFVLLMIKMFSCGINYFPVLDDHIQYGGYPLYDTLSHVYLNIGTISTRPFAALLDPALWGLFYPNLWIALFIISTLFFFGVKFISRTLERLGIFITPFLYAVVLLVPLGFEGSYWISASSRICVGLFFAGASSYMLTKILTQNKKILFVPYIFLTALSFGFYESVMVLSALLQFLVVIGFAKNIKARILYLLTPALLGLCMVIYYKVFGNIGAMGSRANTFELSMLSGNITELFRQFFEIITDGGFKTTVGGLLSGFSLCTGSVFGIITLCLILIMSVLCAYFGGKAPFAAKAKFCIPIGLALTFLPLVPNLLTETVWLTYRSVLPVFIGLVIASAGILGFFLKNNILRKIIIFVMVLSFSLGNISELNTYKKVSKNDDVLVSEIASQLDSQVLSGEKEVIAVIPGEIVTPQVSYYKDHVKSVFDSDWALTGAVRAKTKNIKIKLVTPMDEGLFALSDIDTTSVQIIYIGGNNE